jgi:integrase
MDYFRPDGDVRRDRRAFTDAELQAIFTAAQASKKKRYRLAGTDRSMLYKLAAYTGFRAFALAMLTPASFDFDSEPATVTIPAVNQKNKTTITNPLAPSVASEIKEYLAGRKPQDRVWPGCWYLFAARMLRTDLAAGGVQERTEKGRADFHSFRHTFTSRVARLATTKVAMSLTGHKTAGVIMGYTHVADDDRNAVVQALDAAHCASQPPARFDWQALLAEFEKLRLNGETAIIGDVGRETDGSWVFFGDPLVFGQVHQLTQDNPDASYSTAVPCTASPSSSRAL